MLPFDTGYVYSRSVTLEMSEQENSNNNNNKQTNKQINKQTNKPSKKQANKHTTTTITITNPEIMHAKFVLEEVFRTRKCNSGS